MEPYTHEAIRLLMRNCGYTRLYWLFRTNGFRKFLNDRHAQLQFVSTVGCYQPEWDSLARMVTDMTLGRNDSRDVPLWDRINYQWNRISLPRIAGTMPTPDSVAEGVGKPKLVHDLFLGYDELFLNYNLSSAVMGCNAPIQVDGTITLDDDRGR